MRSSGLEPPRAVKPTRPSTLRVYQFRHERRGREYSLGRRPESPLASHSVAALGEFRIGRRPRTALANACIRPRPPLQCEQVFVPRNRPPDMGVVQKWI
jgi:hypothetical protein